MKTKCRHKNEDMVNCSQTNYWMQCRDCGRIRAGLQDPEELKRWVHIGLLIVSLIFGLTWYFTTGIHL